MKNTPNARPHVFSNHWKLFSCFFQSLELFFTFFPTIGNTDKSPRHDGPGGAGENSPGSSDPGKRTNITARTPAGVRGILENQKPRVFRPWAICLHPVWGDWKIGFALIAALLCAVGTAQAATLGGDAVEGALKIECGNSGMSVHAYLDGVWKQQTFSNNKSSMVHYEQGGTFKYTAGYYSGSAMTCTKNENISSTVNERIWAGGSVQLTMRTTYVSPSRTESYEFEIKNTSGSALSGVKFFHGQDTYLGYSDAGGGFWDATKGVVGVQKPSQKDPGRLIYQTLGSAAQKPDDYASAGYSTVASLVEAGALNYTLNTNYSTDNGYAVQWNKSSLGAGETWSIAAAETMAVGASLTVDVPDALIGTSTVVTGLVENSAESATVNLSVKGYSPDWTVSIVGPTNITVDTGGSAEVLINVTCPPVVSVGKGCDVELTASDETTEASGSGRITAVYYDGVALVQGVTDDGATSISEYTDFGGRLVGSVVTQQFTVYNGGPSNITLLTNALTGSARFQAVGVPASLAVGETQNFSVVYTASDYSTETATLTLFDGRPWSPFVMNLSGCGYVISTNNGPKAGGNIVTITNGALGAGADITQVSIGEKNASIVAQGVNWVSFIVPAQSDAGWKDVVIRSLSEGTKTMRQCYLVNPAGAVLTVTPNSGYYTGGEEIVITGVGLCNGTLADITNVTICGYAATSVSINGSTQVVCYTSAGNVGRGAVIVDSISRGRAIKYNAFIYFGPQINVLGLDGEKIVNGEAPDYEKGTDYSYLAANATITHRFMINNDNTAPLTLSMVTTSGAAASDFTVLEWPTQVLQNVDQPLVVSFTPSALGDRSASLTLYNNTTNSPFTIRLTGSGIDLKPVAGPMDGGTVITITNPALLSAVGRVTNVTVGGASATVNQQGADWVRFTTGPGRWHGSQNISVEGETAERTLFNSFTYNRKGYIFGAYTNDYTSWETLPPLPAESTIVTNLRYAGVAEYDGYVVQLGGVNISAYGYEKSSYRWDGFTWWRGPDLPIAFAGMSATEHDGKLYMMGGYTAAYSSSRWYWPSNCNQTCWTWDGSMMVSNSYISTNTQAHSMAGSLGDELYVMGGLNFIYPTVSSRFQIGTTNLFRHNGADAVWARAPGGVPSNRKCYNQAGVVHSGKLYAVGGAYVSTDSGTEMVNCYTYDGTSVVAIASLPAARRRMAAGVVDGQVYAAGGIRWDSSGFSSSYLYTNTYRLDGASWTEVAPLPALTFMHGGATLDGRLYAIGAHASFVFPARAYESGVTPSSGSSVGGDTVTITGVNLCDGTVGDIVEVRLAGVPVASIISASATQIVVTSAAGGGGLGDVVVESATYGRSVSSDAFTYTGAQGFRVYNTDGDMIAPGIAASTNLDTDFGHQAYGTVLTNWLTISNGSASAVSITGWTTNGGGAFSMASPFALPKSLASGESANFPVVFTANAPGARTAELHIANDMPGICGDYTVNLAASVYQFSTLAGPANGGNVVTLSNVVMGTGSDIYAVLCGGEAVQIVGQGANWVSYVMPSVAWPGVTRDITVRSWGFGDLFFADIYTYLEHAWIGRTDYSSGCWTNLAGGVDDYAVNSLALAPDGSLYAAGSFDKVDGVSGYNSIARWQAGEWHAVSGGLGNFSKAYDTMLIGTNLYVAGDFKKYVTSESRIVTNIIRWTGSEWAGVGEWPHPAPGLNVWGYSLGHDGTNIYMGLYNYNDQPNVPPAQKFDGTTWTDLLPSTMSNSTIYALEYYNGSMYAAGNLRPASYPSGLYTNVIRWTGAAWQNAGSPPTDPASQLFYYCMEPFGGNLYVGNSILGNNSLVRWNGATWSTISGYAGGLSAGVRDMQSDGERLFVSGQAIDLSSGQPYSCMACYDGSGWTSVGQQSLDNSKTVEAMALTPRGIFAAGSFTNMGTNAVSGITQLDRIGFFIFDQTNGLAPSSGSYTGGTSVTIHGYNLGNGTTEDVYRVTLDGVDVASIDSVSSTQIVVTTAAGYPGVGDAAVYTHDYGILVQSNVWSYTGGSGLKLRGVDGNLIANGGTPTYASGNQFWFTPSNAQTNALTLKNDGSLSLTTSGVQTNGTGASAFTCTWPASLAAGSSIAVPVTFAATAPGIYTAAVVVANNSPGGSPFVLNLRGIAADLTRADGPAAGGNEFTITTGTIGDGDDISSVRFGTNSAAILSQTATSVTVRLPAVATIGIRDITIISDSLGELTLPDAFTFNAGGAIFKMEYIEEWTAIAAPPALNLAVAGVVNDQLYAVGGVSANTVYRYDDPVWTLAGTYPVADSVDGAVSTGPYLYTFQSTTNMYRFDGTEWTSQSAPPTAASTLYMASMNGQIYADPFNTTGAYQFDGTNWSVMGLLPSTSAYSDLGVLSNSLYRVGRRASGISYTNVYRYNGSAWVDAPGLPLGLGNMNCATLRGKLYTVGGYNLLTNVFMFDGISWTATVGLPVGDTMYGQRVATCGDYIYALGDRRTNCFRFPTVNNLSGVTPSSGIYTGGTEVVILGTNLCIGDDVTNVTLCGAPVDAILSATPTQVIVRTGVAVEMGWGDVVVYSPSVGAARRTNAFRYAGREFRVLGIDGSVITHNADASEDNGTSFPNTGGGAAVTNTFSITNNGIGSVELTGRSFTGTDADAFSASPMAFSLAEGAVTNVDVVFQPVTGGLPAAALVIESDVLGSLSNYVVNLAGSAWALSSSVGSSEGGVSITITNGARMGYNDIVVVLVDGIEVTPTAQGENWVTFVMPAHGEGAVDILVQSLSLGDTVLLHAYTYMPPSMIYGDSFVWEELPGLPMALSNTVAFASELGDNLYVAGGHDGTSAVTNVFRFDGYRWYDAPGLPAAREGAAVAMLDGAPCLIGGRIGGVPQTNVYLFYGTHWGEIEGLPAARADLAAVGIGPVYAIGGSGSAAAHTNVYQFDGAEWIEVAGLRSARAGMGCAVRRDKIHVYGGRTIGGSPTFNQYVFDGASWASDAGMPAMRDALGSAPLNEHVYAIGGSDGAAAQTNVYRFDGVNWSTVAPLPAPRRSAASVYWRGAIYVLGGSDGTSAKTNMYRLQDGGITPISGYPAGGFNVTIRGTNLCNGTIEDVESVSICDVDAEIVSVSSTQIVVTANATDIGPGHVVVDSLTYGTMGSAYAFTYLRGEIMLIGTNGDEIVEGDPASMDAGTDFGSMLVGASRTNTFGLINTGNAALTLSSVESAGQGGGSFTVIAFPTNELLPGATGQITVVCASLGGDQLGELAFRDNVWIDPALPQIGGYTVSVFNVKSYGAGPGLGLSDATLTFNTPYGVTPAAQTFDVSNVGTDPLTFSNTVAYAAPGENWLTITPTGGIALAASGSMTLTNSVDVSGINVGVHVATVSVWSATATNSPQTCVVTLTLSQTTQSITWTNPGTQTYTNETLLDASLNSGLAPSYTLISGPGSLTNVSYMDYATYTGSGLVTVVASQAGNLNYGAAESLTQSWDVIRAPGVITLTNLTQEYTGSPISPTCLTSPTGLTYSLTYNGGTNAPTNVGDYEVIATITDPLIYGSTTGTLQITKISQTITFPSIPAQHTNATVGVSATGGASGNPVTFSVASGPGSIDSTNLTCSGIGDVAVVASQAASGNYDAAPNVTNLVRVFSVTPDNGPYAGGNTITITNGNFGTVTNVLVEWSSSSVSPDSTGASWVTITMPATTNAGLTDITLQTPEYGDILLTDAYTYNPAGEIGVDTLVEYRVDFSDHPNPDYPTNTSPDGTYIWTHVQRTNDWKELKTTDGSARAAWLGIYNFTHALSNGWNISAGGYDWIATNAAYNVIYLYGSTYTNYVVITNLPGNSYQVDVINSYHDSFTQTETLHGGVYDLSMPADNGQYGNWPSGGNTNAGLGLDVRDVYNSRTNYVTWTNAVPSNGAISFVMSKPELNGNMLNCMRIKGYESTVGLFPDSGSWTGGYLVVINGISLGNGADITNVTLCGVTAAIQPGQSSTQVVVLAGTDGSGLGDVIVQSTSFGTTTKSNAFTYNAPNLSMLGTNGAAIANGSAAGVSNGTQFGSLIVGMGGALTNVFSITNSGNTALNISGVTTGGAAAASFTISGVPAILNAGGVSNVTVVFQPTTGGTLDAALTLANNGVGSPYVLNLRGIGIGGGISLATNALTFQATYQSNNPSAQSFGMTNVGVSGFTYTNVSTASWLIPSPTDGSLVLHGATVLTNAINVAGLNAGTHTATNRIVSLDATNSPQAVVITLTVDKASQAITFGNPGAQETTDAVGLQASAGSGLVVTCSVVSGSAAITGYTNLTFSGAGSVSIAAHQAGNSNWYGASSVTQTFSVSKAVATVTLTNLSQTYDGSARSVGSVTAPTGLTVNITYDGGATAPTNTGSYTVIGIVSDVMYQGGTTGTLVVSKNNQTITFPGIAAQDSTNIVGLAATASSTLSPTFAVLSGPGSIAGGTNLSFTASGTVLITADQPGDTNWSAAPQVTNSITVNKSAQGALNFTPTNTMIYLTTNRLTTTGGAGTGAVSYAVQDGPGAIIGVDGLSIHSGSGVVTVVATKALDDMYAAQAATALVYCARSGQAIDFPTIGKQRLTNTVLLSATAQSGLAVTFRVASGPGAINGGTNLTFTDKGVVAVEAYQGGDTNWNEAWTTQTVLVAKSAIYLDFDGDAKADITVFEPESGRWSILQSSLNTGRVQPWGWPGSVPTPGDYDGDGLYDVAVYCSTNGLWYIWQSDSQSGRLQAWGAEGMVPVSADYDGDGITDVAVYDAAVGRWHIWQSATQTERAQAWGFENGVPAPGDYDGDGMADVTVYDSESGTWYILQSSTDTGRTQPWGWADAEPIPGDYDGDGLTDVAVYWPESGMWYVWLSATQVGSTHLWGWDAALPVPADYDGDGIFDRTVYAPEFGLWYIWQTRSNTSRTQPWGFEQAEPVN